MKTYLRTAQQNKAYWKFQEEVAQEMISQGISLKQILNVLDIRPTKESLHEIFKFILEKKFNKTSTTKMTREEMNACLEDYMFALNNTGMEVYFPDEYKKQLLENYE